MLQLGYEGVPLVSEGIPHPSASQRCLSWSGVLLPLKSSHWQHLLPLQGERWVLRWVGSASHPPLLEPHMHPCAAQGLVLLLLPSKDFILASAPHGKPANSSFSLRLSDSSRAPAPVAAHRSVPLLWAVTHEHVPSHAPGQPEAAKAATCHHIPRHAEKQFNSDPGFIKATWNHRFESWLHWSWLRAQVEEHGRTRYCSTHSCDRTHNYIWIWSTIFLFKYLSLLLLWVINCFISLAD